MPHVTTSLTLLRDDDQTKVELSLDGLFSRDSSGLWLEDWDCSPRMVLSEAETERCVSALYREAV